MLRPPYNIIQELTSEQVIFFIRIRGKSSYFKNVYGEMFLSLFVSVKDFRCISEYQKDADVYIDLNCFKGFVLDADLYKQITNEIDINQVIRRCRGLRGISWAESFDLIVRCYLFLDRFYRGAPQLKMLVCGAVDNYVMDIMCRMAKFRGVMVMPITSSILCPDYRLVSAYGEMNYVSEPTEGDLNYVINKIKSRFIKTESKGPDYIYSIFYVWGSYVYRFLFRYLLMYKILGQKNYEYRFFFKISFAPGVFDVLQYLKLGDGKELKEIENRKICYIPLHVFPEAVTDYWVDDDFHSMHLLSLKSIINKLIGLGYIVVLKEHPFNFLKRPRNEYQAIQRDGVLILRPHVDVSAIIEKAELVVVWNGSTGIELCTTQKKLAFVVESYYNKISTCKFNVGESVSCLSEDEKINIIKAAVRSSIRVG